MRMPTCLAQALFTMLPRLEAEESLLAADRVAMGTGSMKKESADATWKRWATATGHGADAAKPRPTALAAHGIPVRRVKTGRKKKA